MACAPAARGGAATMCAAMALEPSKAAVLPAREVAAHGRRACVGLREAARGRARRERER